MERVWGEGPKARGSVSRATEIVLMRVGVPVRACVDVGEGAG